jgi:ABC-type Mn2+/Zn2+ transport system permease subunit
VGTFFGLWISYGTNIPAGAAAILVLALGLGGVKLAQRLRVGQRKREGCPNQI